MKVLMIYLRQEQFEVVCNLAAQAGVRYSIENPKAYIDSNIFRVFKHSRRMSKSQSKAFGVCE